MALYLYGSMILLSLADGPICHLYIVQMNYAIESRSSRWDPIKCFSDVFRVGVWSDPSWLDDPELSKLTPDLIELQLSSLLPQFQNKYLVVMFKTTNVVAPEHPPHVALFQLNCILSAMEKKRVSFFLLQTFFSLKRVSRAPNVSFPVHSSKRRSDQNQEGHTIMSAKLGKSTSPVSINARLLKCFERSQRPSH